MKGDFYSELVKFIKGNKTLFLTLLVAVIVLISLKLVTPTSSIVPNKNSEEQNTAPVLLNNSSSIWRSMENELEKDLSKFLSNIKGCGKVDVMIRIKKDESKVRAIDVDKSEKKIEEVDSTGITRTTTEIRITQKTVQESSNGGYQTVWIEMNAPEIEGVIVISEGADNASVKASLIKAISTYFNIPAYKITVMPGGK